jgi:hypothetical protein
MKDNKWFILFALIIIGGFLWFQVRPAIFRNYCQNWARDRGNDYFNSVPLSGVTDLVKKGQLQIQYMDGAYKRCMHDKGIE